MDMHSKIIVCTTLYENGNKLRTDRFEKKEVGVELDEN
jgi:hypothetical protein